MKILFFANTDWYLYNFRLGFARYLRSQGHEVVMVSPPGDHGSRLQAEGFRWIAMDMTRRSLNPLREAVMVLKLIALYRAERPALAHHFTLKCVVYGAIAARIARVPAAVHAIAGFGHIFVSDRPLARLLRPVVRRLLRAACDQPGAAVIVQNADDLAAVRRMELSANVRLRLIRGSGVDITRFRPPAGAHPVDQVGPVVVLFVGRLLIDKGIAEFVAAAAIGRLAMPGTLRFVAAGEPDFGNPAAVAPALLETWKKAGDVEFLGHVEDMVALLACADIVVLPSYGEGAPRSLIEAAACGIPLIATDVRGCREVVLNGVNGLLVPQRSVPALAAAVLRLAGDAELRKRMGQAGRQHVLDELDERTVFDRTYHVYRQLQAGPDTDSHTGLAIDAP